MVSWKLLNAISQEYVIDITGYLLNVCLQVFGSCCRWSLSLCEKNCA